MKYVVFTALFSLSFLIHAADGREPVDIADDPVVHQTISRSNQALDQLQWGKAKKELSRLEAYADRMKSEKQLQLYDKLVYYYEKAGFYSDSRRIIEKRLNAFTTKPDGLYRMAQWHTKLARVQAEQLEINEALITIGNVLSLGDSLSSAQIKYIAYQAMMRQFIWQEQWNEAWSYYIAANKIIEKTSDKDYPLNFVYTRELYHTRLFLALDSMEKAKTSLIRAKRLLETAPQQLNRGQYFLAKSRLEFKNAGTGEALAWNERAIQQFEAGRDMVGLFQALQQEAHWQSLLGNVGQSVLILRRMEFMAEQMEPGLHLGAYLKLGAEIYQELGRSDKVLSLNKALVVHQDNLLEQQQQFRTTLTQLNLLSQKLERENKILSQQKEIAALQAQNLQHELNLKSSRIQRIVLSIIILACLSAGVFIFIYYQRLRSSNQELMSKNDLVELQSRQITHINKRLENQNNYLQRIHEEKENAIRIITHDLKAPLDRIRGLIDVLLIKKHLLNEDQRYLLDKMKQVILDGTDTVVKLLDIKSLEDKRLGRNTTQVDIDAFVENAVETYEPLAEKKNLSLHYSGRIADKHAVIDTYVLNRILDNLISNAIKFSYPGKNIYVDLTTGSLQFTIAIKDEGPGIAPEDQKRLFQRYERLSPRPTGGESSTGLGLFIVRSLTESMGGTIRCESHVGEGTTFILRIPLNREALSIPA